MIVSFFLFLAPPLAAFRNRIKSDPEYKAKVEKEFHKEDDDDYKLFSSII